MKVLSRGLCNKGRFSIRPTCSNCFARLIVHENDMSFQVEDSHVDGNLYAQSVYPYFVCPECGHKRRVGYVPSGTRLAQRGEHERGKIERWIRK